MQECGGYGGRKYSNFDPLDRHVMKFLPLQNRKIASKSLFSRSRRSLFRTAHAGAQIPQVRTFGSVGQNSAIKPTLRGDAVSKVSNLEQFATRLRSTVRAMFAEIHIFSADLGRRRRTDRDVFARPNRSICGREVAKAATQPTTRRSRRAGIFRESERCTVRTHPSDLRHIPVRHPSVGSTSLHLDLKRRGPIC